MKVTIKIGTAFGGVRDMKVEGTRIGDWMFHRIPDLPESPVPSPGHGWRVSHVCGAAISTLVDDLTKHDAKRIARALSDALWDFPAKITPSEILYAKWVEEWGPIAEAVVAEALGGAA